MGSYVPTFKVTKQKLLSLMVSHFQTEGTTGYDRNGGKKHDTTETAITETIITVMHYSTLP